MVFPVNPVQLSQARSEYDEKGVVGSGRGAWLLMHVSGRVRCVLPSLLAAAWLTFAVPTAALELRVAAWNLEHLDDMNGAGCVGREDDDYRALAERIDALGADVVTFQEVENVAAAQRVFDAERWSVEVSGRPSTGTGASCSGRPAANLGHLATGIAVRKGLEYTRNDDLSSLAGGNRYLRWGTDVTVERDGQELRVFSVHLKSGCWGADQDDRASSASACATLRTQMETLAGWIADQREAGEAFVIAGDFNRRLAIPDDWAWAILTEDAPTLSLPTVGRISRCDARFPEYIDHLVFDADAGVSMVVGSFEEGARSDPHPDHCVVSARISVAPEFVTVPFLVAASDTPPFGFVRAVNPTGESGTVEITAIDDTGVRFGPVSLTLGAGAVGTFSSSDLEEGAAHRGLSEGVGDGSGHWRLELDTDLDIAARAYARSPGGYVSRIDATVAGTYEAGMHRYEVVFFNPGSNMAKWSTLRLVNPGDAAAEVTVVAIDNAGEAAPEGDVVLTVPAGKALELSAQALESGGEDFDGRFGVGEGKWRLTVRSDRVLHVLSLVRSREGYVASLSH